MNLLFDTNSIVGIVQAANYSGLIQFLNPKDASIYISVVSEAEIKSLARQNSWEGNRRDIPDEFLDQVNIIEINKLSVNDFKEIDSYSQLANPGFSKYPFTTPRNMGENDLWISSVAALLGLQLVTTGPILITLTTSFLKSEKLNRRNFYRFFKK